MIWVFGFFRSNPDATGRAVAVRPGPTEHQVSVRWFLRELHKFTVLVLDTQEFAPSLETLQGDALEKLLGILNLAVPVLQSLQKYYVACAVG